MKNRLLIGVWISFQKLRLKLLISAFSLFSLYACGLFERDKAEENKKGRVVARVHNDYLYEEDLKGIWRGPGSNNDSALIVLSYIETWIKNKLLFEKALNNLTDSEKNMKEELDQYYESLIKFKYEQKLIDQRLNIDIDDSEIEQYYQKHKENFRLKKCILRIIFLKLPLQSSEINQVYRWMRKEEINDVDNLHKYAIKQALLFNLDDKKWFFADELAHNIPHITGNCMTLYPGMRSLQDSSFSYVIKIKEIKKQGEIAPMEFEKEKIRNIILHKRRIDLIKRVKESVFNEGMKKKYFEIYE
jgi:hypothetical protein